MLGMVSCLHASTAAIVSFHATVASTSKTLSDMGAGGRSRTGDLPFTRSPACRPGRPTCTDGPATRPDCSRCTGSLSALIPRPIPRRAHSWEPAVTLRDHGRDAQSPTAPPECPRQDDRFDVRGLAIVKKAACYGVHLAPGGADVVVDKDVPAGSPGRVWDPQCGPKLSRCGTFRRRRVPCGSGGCLNLHDGPWASGVELPSAEHVLPGGHLQDPLGVRESLSSRTDVGRIREDQVRPVGGSVLLQPPEQQPPEDQRPSVCAFVLVPDDLAPQGARQVGDRLYATDPAAGITAQPIRA